MSDDQKHTYKEAGVDIKEAAEFVGDIGALRARTEHSRKLFGAFGLFAAAYDLSDYDEPVILTGCDGVGTKIELLLKHDMPEAAGKDLVAMSVNDVLTTGGDPLLFLDYLGVPKLDRAMLARFVGGMVDYLEACNCILAGGETAEMPGIVPEGTVELSGFCIGCVEKRDLIDPSTIAEGDLLIGYRSDGPHANGWSLIRRILDTYPDEFSDEDIRAMLAPTRLYHDVVSDQRTAGLKPRAHVHITGGGLPENIERVLGERGAALTIPTWEAQGMDKLLAHTDAEDRFDTFNMGIGWVSIVAPEDREAALAAGAGGIELGVVGGPGNITVEVA